MSYNAYGQLQTAPSTTRSGQQYQPLQQYNPSYDATTVYNPNSNYTGRVNGQYTPEQWQQAVKGGPANGRGGRKTRVKRRKGKRSRRR